MKILRVNSGIGNQLFMYSFYLYLSKELNEDIYIDISSYSISSYRKFELSIIIPKYNTFKLKFNDVGLHGIKRQVHSFMMKFSKYKIIDENDFRKYDEFPENCYFKGYWQDLRFIDYMVKNYDINELFQPKEQKPQEICSFYNKICHTEKSVSIHIRRGDFFKKGYENYQICDKDYYNKALNIIEEKIGQYHLFVFSDDLDWVKANIALPSNGNYTIIPNYEINGFWYIYLMSKCQNNIIPNSTFSWWGAFLNNNPDKIIISPKLWLLNKPNFCLSMKNWIML